MTMKYSVGDEVRITDDVDSLTRHPINIPHVEAVEVAGKVGVVGQVHPYRDLPYRVDVPGETSWRYPEGQLTLASEAASDPGPETTSDAEPEKGEDAAAVEARLMAELAAFKVLVGNKAMELARRYGWCEVTEEALAELGIEVDTKKVCHVHFDLKVPHDVDIDDLDVLEADIRRRVMSLLADDPDWRGVELVDDTVNLIMDTEQ